MRKIIVLASLVAAMGLTPGVSNLTLTGEFGSGKSVPSSTSNAKAVRQGVGEEALTADGEVALDTLTDAEKRAYILERLREIAEEQQKGKKGKKRRRGHLPRGYKGRKVRRPKNASVDH